jgi:hypothetical protein
MMVEVRSIYLSILALNIAGCTVDSVDTSSAVQPVVVQNRLTANRLTANRLTANRLTANRLTANRLTANRLTLNASADDLLNTDDGRELLTFILQCAIPADQTFEGTATSGPDAGTTFEFNGEVGLAPEWMDRALDEDGSHWVSACLFSRVNAVDLTVPISIRGPNSALATSADELANWTLEEGAFYGEYFLPLTEPIAWFACSGRDSASSASRNRLCALPDPAHPGLTQCGFNYAGPCGQFTAHGLHACESQSTGTFYRDCATSPIFRNEMHGHHDGGDDHGDAEHDDHSDHGDHDDGDHGRGHGRRSGILDEVITTFLQ